MIILYDLLNDTEYRFKGPLDRVELQLRHIFHKTLDSVADGDMAGIINKINHMSYWMIKEENARPI